jgi:hypothetical protein
MRLSANAVRLAYSFAAKSDVRYYLQGVHVEPHPNGGAAITGCDGHRVLQVHDRDATDVETMVIGLDESARAALKKGKYVKTEFEPKKLAILNGDELPIYLQWTDYRVVGNYPDVKTILGERESWIEGISGTFNVNYIADATIAAAKAVSGKKIRSYIGVSFYSKKSERPGDFPYDKLLFIVEGETPAWGCVMGMRGEGPDALKIAFPEPKAA